MYIWSPANTPDSTQAFIAERALANVEVADVSHFPMIDATERTAAENGAFFSDLLAER